MTHAHLTSNTRPAQDGAHATLGVQRVTLRAGERTLLDAFTHTFYAGEIWCVAGPNGAGKTTLLSALAGLLQPSAGQVELDGMALRDWQPLPLAQRRALMPQSAADAFSATVLDIVLLNRFPHLNGWGWEREADRDRSVDRDRLLHGCLAEVERRHRDTFVFR